MLTIHCDGAPHPSVWVPGTALPGNAVWLDLCEPQPSEIRACEDLLALRLPDREDIAGVGLAGRNHCIDDAVFLQVSRFPDLEADRDGAPATPLSLVLTPKVLVTQRYANSGTFDVAAGEWHKDPVNRGSASALAELLENMAERTAQTMQGISERVTGLSREMFADRQAGTRRLRRWLVRVGSLEARLARSRGALLGVARVVAFLSEKAPAWVPAETQSRIAMVRNDLDALNHFDAQLTQKLQFLLDANFGLISANQNNVMKLFTVASVVAAPPMLLASIWGMNFKAMPELSQPWGYGMALGLILGSILVSLAILRWRGWLSND